MTEVELLKLVYRRKCRLAAVAGLVDGAGNFTEAGRQACIAAKY